MRAQGQTRQPITGEEWLRPCSAARLNLDINAFKISENCIPCDFLTFQKSTLLFLCAPEFESKPALLDFVVEGRSCFGFWIHVWIRCCELMTGRCGNGRARPRHRQQIFQNPSERAADPAPAPLVFWSPDDKYRKTVILKSAAIRHIGSSWFRIRDQKLVRRPFWGALAGTLSFFSKFSYLRLVALRILRKPDKSILQPA